MLSYKVIRMCYNYERNKRNKYCVVVPHYKYDTTKSELSQFIGYCKYIIKSNPQIKFYNND